MTMAAAALCSCSEEEEYTPGTPEDESSYGVYFPSQTTSTTVELAPQEKTTVSFRLRRKKTDDEITVPVNVTASEKGIFVIDPVVFKTGEKETNITINFPAAKVGVKYECVISIDDPEYVTIYGPLATSLTFTVTRAGWNLVKSPDGKSTTGKWRDDIICSLYSLSGSGFNPNPELDVEIYEREDMKGYYRMKVYGGNTFLKAFSGMTNVKIAENKDAYTYVDARDADKVYLPNQTTGMTFNSDNGEISFGSYTPENFSLDESAAQYGTLRDGVITFPAKGIMVTLSSLNGGWYNGNLNGATRITLPGYKAAEYSVTLTKGTMGTNGVLPVTAKLSDDIKTLKYAFFDGTLDDGEASLKAQDLNDGTLKFDGEINDEIDGKTQKTFTMNIQVGKTGKYTMVGCGYDAEGHMQTYTALTFGYIAKGDTKKVNINFGIEASHDHAGEGITPDNSGKLYAYGEEIESLTFGLYKASRVKDADLDKLLDNSGLKFTTEQLKAVNGSGFSSMVTGLNGDSEYTLVMRADNGYTTSTSAVTYKTTGTFNPGLETYIYNEFTEEQPSVEYLTSTKWNYYAISYLDDEPVRRQFDPVTMKINTKESGNGEYWLDIDGLQGFKFDEAGSIFGIYLPTTRSSNLKSYNGAFMLLADQQNTLGVKNDELVFTGFMTEEDLQNIYGTTAMLFGQVADGYLYCVPNPVYQMQGYTFSYMAAIGMTTYNTYALMTDMMLVDPAKDKGGISSAALANMAKLRRQALAGFSGRMANYVELPEFNHMTAVPGNFGEEPAINLATDLIPASAPAARHAEVKVTKVSSGESGYVDKDFRFVGVRAF